MGIVHQDLRSRVCVFVCVLYVWVSMHPLNIVILLPLYASPISYKMTHLRNCYISRPRTRQPLPGAHGQHVCVVCECLQPMCKCVCVCEHTG